MNLGCYFLIYHGCNDFGSCGKCTCLFTEVHGIKNHETSLRLPWLLQGCFLWSSFPVFNTDFYLSQIEAQIVVTSKSLARWGGNYNYNLFFSTRMTKMGNMIKIYVPWAHCHVTWKLETLFFQSRWPQKVFLKGYSKQPNYAGNFGEMGKKYVLCSYCLIVPFCLLCGE